MNEMSKPLRFSKKPKPDAMLARAKFSIVLSTIDQSPHTRSTKTSTCVAMLRTRGS